MGASTKTSKYAVGFTFASFLFILVAFVSPYWLQTDGRLPNPKFENLGLWELCLNDFQDIHRFYDVRFTGCMWIFEEEYYIIHDYILPPFFVTVQFFFTLSFALHLLAILMTLLFLGCSRDSEKYIVLLLTNGTTLVASGLMALLSVILFGCYGDSRDWMPNWEHNNMGWAFAMACIGAVMLFPAGILFLVEARRIKYRRLNDIGNREGAYSMDDRRYGGHSDI